MVHDDGPAQCTVCSGSRKQHVYMVTSRNGHFPFLTTKKNCVFKIGSMIAANNHTPTVTEAVPTMSLTSKPRVQYTICTVNLSIPYTCRVGKSVQSAVKFT